MATDTHIPESVYLKQISDNALSSEILEEKVSELLVGNKVKHVESIGQVVETVNTQIEASIPTNESGTFFHALSVPVVTSNTPESYDAATTKDQDPEFVKTSDRVKDHTEEITPGVEIKQKSENQGLDDGITTDVSVSRQTETKGETIENEEKNVEKEACEEKDESAVGLILSDSMAPSKLEALNTLELNQDETYEDIKEKMPGQYTTPVADIKEKDLNEFVKEETEDKSADAQQEIEQPKSVQKIVQDEETEEISPSVEIEEKMDAITTDASISAQTRSQVEKTEHEEKDEEEATLSDDGQKEKSDIPTIKDVCEENSSEKVEYESVEVKLNEKPIAIVNKDEDQEVNVLEKVEGGDVVTLAEEGSFEGNEHGVVTGKESIEDDTEEIRSSVEETDVRISTQTKPEEETTKDEEKNEEIIESVDGQTKAGSHMVKDICEDTVSEMTESEQGLKPSDSSSTVLNGTEIVIKDEDQEKEQELYVSEKVQTESEVKTTKLEQVNEEVTESEDGQKKNSDSLSIKEVCEETESEKVESEGVELSVSSSIKLNEKVITTLCNDEVREKEQNQDEDDVTLRDDINTDVCVSTQAGLEKETSENEDKNDEKAIEKEVCEETSTEKAESEVGLQPSDSMAPNEKEDLSAVEKDKGDSDGVKSAQDTTCEDTIETTPGQYAATVTDFKEQDLNEFVKEETEDTSTDAQQASEEYENGENDKTEPKSEESDKHEVRENEEVDIFEKDQGKDDFTSSQDVLVEGDLQEKNHHSDEVEREIVEGRESIEENTQEIKSSVETPEKQRLKNVVPTDVCISTQIEPDETTETLEKDEEAIESGDGQAKKSGIPVVEEICEETDLEKDEKVESEEGLKLSKSTSTALNENEVVSKDEDQEKVQELYVSENDQSVGNDVTSSQNTSNEDPKETTIAHVTTVANLEEEAEDKVIDAQEASEPYVDRANDNKEQNPKDSVKDIVHIEHEYSEEIKPSVETNDKKEDICISTPTESQEEATKNEEKAVEDDDDLKEKSDILFVKEVCEETVVKETESEEAIEISDSSKMNLNEKAIEIISKDEDQKEEQETNTVVFEDEVKEKNYDGECNEDEIVQTGEIIKGEYEDLRTSVETEEIMEEQGSVHGITSDVSILAQKESQEDTTKNEEKNEEPVESDDSSKEKHDISSVKDFCKETSLEKVESEQGLEVHDSLNTKINDKTITFKDEDQEKDQEVNMPEEVQGKGNVSSSRDAISKEEEDLLQKNYQNESNEPEFVKSRENVDEEIKSSVEKVENSEPQGFSHITTNDQAKEETTEIEAKLDAEKKADITEDKSEMEDEVVSTEKMSLEERTVEEIEASLTKTTEEEVTKKDEDSSHIHIQDTNDGTTKEEKCFLNESRDIEISTLEHEPTEEQNIGLNEVSKENFTDLNETTVVEPRDTPPSSLEPSTQDTSNLEKAKEESETLPTEIQIPEVVPNSEEPKLREECLIPVTEMHLDDEIEIIRDENSSDEKTEQLTEIKKETFEEVSEQCENGEKNKEEEKPMESVKLEDQEKEQEVNTLKKDQCEDEITSAQDMEFKAGVRERNHDSEGNEQEVVTMKEIIVEDIEEKTPENEEKNDEKVICEEIISEKVESEEGLKLSDSPSIAVNEASKDEYLETGQGVYVSEKGQGGEDDLLSSENASIENIKESTHGQHATTVSNFEEETGESAVTEEIIMEKAQDNPIDAKEMSTELGQPKEQNVKEIGALLTTTTNEKTEDEITKKDEDSLHDNMEDTNDNTLEEEKCTLENEPVEEQNGRSFDEVSKENLMDLNDTAAVKPLEDTTLSGTLGTSTEDTSKSEKAKAESEVLRIEDLESVSDIQIIQALPNSEENETVTEENSSDEKTEQTIEIKQETSSEKAESEGFKLSDSSNMEINEKVMPTFNDEDQEKSQEVNVSAEGQGKDNVTIAQVADVEEEVLPEKNHQNKDNEQEFVETRESIDEDTKEIISSVETREDKSEIPLSSEVCEATNSEKAELEEGLNHSESFITEVVKNETVSKEENLEKKQELMSEVQGGGDDVISSNVSNEDIKETTIDQCASTAVDFEDGQDVSETTKEILVEEAAEDKSVDAQEASEPCGNEAKDKSEQNLEESVDKPAEICVEIPEENITEDDANAGNKEEIEAKLDEESQADSTEDRSEVKDEVVSTEKMPSEHGQPKEQNIQEIEACLTETIAEKSEDEITKKEEDSSQENIEDPNVSTSREEKRPLEHEPAEEEHGGLDEVSKENITNLYETTAVESQEDITPSSSLGTSTEDALAKVESENLPTEDLESVSEVQIPQVVSKSADEKDKEECLISESATKEILRVEQADKSYVTTEENVSQLEQIGDNNSSYEKRDIEQENPHNSTEECDEMVKDVILTEKISYADSIPVINREVTEVRVDTLMGQEDLQAAEDISCESTIKSESVDESSKEDIIPSLEEVKSIEPEVNLSNIESTAYLSESEKLPAPALESVCDVQASEVSVDSEDRKVKEEFIVSATAQHTDENKSEEEQKNNATEILSVPVEENVKQVPEKSDEEKSDLNSEEQALITESPELHGELKPASESVIEEEKVKIIEPQPEQSDISSEKIINDQESKLEHHDEDLILAPENDMMKNVTLTDEVSVKDNCPTELDKTSTSNEKELANEVELLKPILVANTDVTTEAKAESNIEEEIIQPEEDLNSVPKAFSTIIGEEKDDSVDEASKSEIIPVPEIESTDTPLNEQDSVKLTEVIPCSSQETVDEKVVPVSQLTDREILEAPDVTFDKRERDEELISNVQPPEAILKTEVKEEHPEATNDTCETPMAVELIEKKLVSTVPLEELTSPMVEDKTNELVSETDKTKVEHSSISNTDQNPTFTKEEFTETFSEDQTSIKERYIEEEGQVNFSVENKEEKGGNEVVEDVNVVLEDETAKESNTNKEDIHNQLTSATDEIYENERSSSNPDELVEKKDSVEDTEDSKLMAENLYLKDESFTFMKASHEDSDLVTPKLESLENMVTEEKIIKTDANEEKEPQDEPQAYDLAQTTSEEKPNEVSDVVEVVSEGREATAVLKENLQEDSSDIISAEYEPEITTATEKIEDKMVECLSVEKTGELQVSTLNSEIDEGKQNVPGDIQNKEKEAVLPQELSEDIKIDDSLVLPSVEKDTKQGEDTRFEEAPVIDVLKNEKVLDHSTEVKSVDVASNAECLELEPPHPDTKEVSSELINQENKKEADENMETLIPLKDVTSSTKVNSEDLEVPSVMDPNNKKDEAYVAEIGVQNDNEHLKSTGDRSKPVEEVSGMKQEVDAPVTLGTGATDDLTKISETQPDEASAAACTVDKQSPNEDVEDLSAIKALTTEPQCNIDVLKEDEKMSDEKVVSPEATKVDLQVTHKNIIVEREVALTKDEKLVKEEEEDNEKTGDAPVMVEASKDIEVKVHKKSHNILSGVGSKVKHSIAKVKKAITGKSSHPKPPSP